MLGKVFDTNFGATNLLLGSSNDSSMSLGIRNSSEYFDVSANGNFSYSPSSASYSLGGNAQFRSTMGFAGTHIAFSRQIPDSFLLITASPELRGKTVLYKINNGTQYLRCAEEMSSFLFKVTKPPYFRQNLWELN